MSLPSFIAEPDPLIYLSDNYIVCDFETDTQIGYGHARHPENQLLLACWHLGPGHPENELIDHAGGGRMNDHMFARWGNELDQQPLVELIDQADFVVAHAAKYELAWFMRLGIDIRKVLVFDTQLAEYVLLGNLAAGNKELGMRPHSTSLDMCCRRRGLPIKDPVVDELIHNGVNPRDIPRAWLQGRCEQDVVTTEQVFLSQRTELHRRGMLPVLFTRCLLTPVLADIECEGMAVDLEAVDAEYQKYVAERNRLQKQMDELTGGINTRSAVQMPKFLYETMGFSELTDKRGNPQRNEPSKAFPAGAPKYDQKTIDKLEVSNQQQRDFIELHKALAKANAVLSKTLNFLRGAALEYGGRFYGEIHQTRTATHRTSSLGVPLVFEQLVDDEGKHLECSLQFQNFPRILKKLLKAKRPGWLMAEPDGSQIEFRAAAILGDDDVAIADICDLNFDAHVQTAGVLYNMTREQVLQEKKDAAVAGRDDLRQLSKPRTFKPLYGGKYGTPEEERYYKWFREHYNGISRTQDRWVEEAVDTLQQRTPWGLTYYWPFAKRDRRGRVNCETAVDNYPIQALATAEIAPIAVVYLWHRIAEEGLEDQVRIVNLVHDSAPTELHPDAVPAYTRIVKQAFTADVYRYLERVYGMKIEKVPLGVGLKVGTHWGTGKEQSWDIFSNGREVQRK